MDPDFSTIQRIQAGDENALLVLMSNHKEAIFRLAWRYTMNEHDAAEIAEETFVRAFFAADKFRPKAQVKTWLFTIAANLCRDHLRRRKKEAKTSSLDAPISNRDTPGYQATIDPGTPDPRQLLETREKLHMIEEAIFNLPHKLVFPFVFCAIEGHSYDECAAVLNTSRKGVETRIYRARLKLRKELARVR